MSTAYRLAGTAVAVALTWALAGCDGGGGASPKESSSSPAAEGMIVVCPKVEAAIPSNMGVPSLEQLNRLHEALVQIQTSADLEASNAVGLLIFGVEQGIDAYTDGATTMPALAASRALLDGLDAIAGRCKAAGSSALQ